MNIPDEMLGQAKTILDVGGWFKPEPRATHVVDLMPWETRGVTLSLAPLPHERFSKATWFQADFLQPGFRLPFADKTFDLVLCGHTIEDLADPRGLLAEMQRVAARGIIECPSRLTEQTKGMRDRESILPGHPHHHWIVESVDGRLLLYAKADSDLRAEARLLPLLFAERHMREVKGADIVLHAWQDSIDYRVITGPACRTRATEYAASLPVSTQVRLKDRLLRFARRLRRKWRGVPAEDLSWWPKIVATSRPYSSIELK